MNLGTKSCLVKKIRNISVIAMKISTSLYFNKLLKTPSIFGVYYFFTELIGNIYNAILVLNDYSTQRSTIIREMVENSE